MPIPKKESDFTVRLVGGPEDGLTLVVPARTAQIGRWDTDRVLWRYDVDEASGTATVVPG